MASLATTYTFASGATIASAQVNQNFTDVETFVNGNVPHCDGTNVFTGQPQFTGTSAEGDLDNLVNMRYLLSGGYTKSVSGGRGGSTFATRTVINASASDATYYTAISGASISMTNGQAYFLTFGFENAHTTLTGGSAFPMVARMTIDADVFYAFGWQPGTAGSGTFGASISGGVYFTCSAATGSYSPTLALASFGVSGSTQSLGYYGASWYELQKVNV
jgi:hypothetical protein